jgi:hypothetical protein
MASAKIFPLDKRVKPSDVVSVVQEWIGGRYKYLPAEHTRSFTLNTYDYKVDLRRYWLYVREIGTQDTPIGGVVLLHGDDVIGDGDHRVQAIIAHTGVDGLIGFEEFVQAGFPQREYYEFNQHATDYAEHVAPFHTAELLLRLGIIGEKLCEHCGGKM